MSSPKTGDEQTDQVRLRGDSKVVSNIKTELEKQVAVLKQTIIVGVTVPAAQHASKIGRGGAALQDLQRKTGAVVHFPGSRQYSTIGEIENSSELEGVDPKDVVKVIGTKEVCAAATEILQQSPPERAPRSDSRGGRATPDLPTKTINIPAKYYHAIADQQNLIRQIRSAGGFVSLPPAPSRTSVKPSANGNGNSIAAKTARIDLDGGEDDVPEEGDFELRSNYQEGQGDEELAWVVRAKEEDLDKASAVLEAAVERAKAATHVGLLTGLPRSAFPRIIGSKGATISRLRADTGADIQVGKDDDLITLTGGECRLILLSRPRAGRSC